MQMQMTPQQNKTVIKKKQKHWYVLSPLVSAADGVEEQDVWLTVLPLPVLE